MKLIRRNGEVVAVKFSEANFKSLLDIVRSLYTATRYLECNQIRLRNETYRVCMDANCMYEKVLSKMEYESEQKNNESD